MNGHRQHGPGPNFGGEGFDPEEIFNMFFNGGFGGARYAVLHVSAKNVTL